MHAEAAKRNKIHEISGSGRGQSISGEGRGSSAMASRRTSMVCDLEIDEIGRPATIGTGFRFCGM